MSDTPSTASVQPDPVPPAVTDRRPVPRGVLPRGVQTWIMVGVAAGMLAIMLIVGRPDPPSRPAQAVAPAQAPSADRVRDYQDRLRSLEAQALRESQMAGVTQPEPAPFADSAPAPAQDPIAEERKRREYESLFASNVVLSRRPENERPDQGRINSMPGAPPQTGSPSPSVDEVADAVVRASARTANAFGTGAPAAQTPVTTATSEPRPPDPAQRRTPDYTPPISAAGPLHRLLEGTIIDTVLTNRLDGATAAPVNCLVTNALYSHTGRQVIVPAGARILGETKPVQAFGETRLAVSFHRLLMPDGRSYRLDQFMGLNQIGDAGLRDKVNHHFLSTFGAAAAVGLISGLSQYLGSAGLGSGDGNRTIVIAGGVGDATAQAAMQVMNRFLNRLPTITIREGHRVKVYLTLDVFLFRVVCGNHIIWGFQHVAGFRRRHVGASIQDEWTASLASVRTALDADVADDRLVLLRAQSRELGPDRAAVIDTAVQRLELSQKQAGEAYMLAETFESNPRSVWGYVQGLTRLSQRTPWQDGRFVLDRAASRLLTTVH